MLVRIQLQKSLQNHIFGFLFTNKYIDIEIKKKESINIVSIAESSGANCRYLSSNPVWQIIVQTLKLSSSFNLKFEWYSPAPVGLPVNCVSSASQQCCDAMLVFTVGRSHTQLRRKGGELEGKWFSLIISFQEVSIYIALGRYIPPPTDDDYDDDSNGAV